MDKEVRCANQEVEEPESPLQNNMEPNVDPRPLRARRCSPMILWPVASNMVDLSQFHPNLAASLAIPEDDEESEAGTLPGNHAIQSVTVEHKPPKVLKKRISFQDASKLQQIVEYPYEEEDDEAAQSRRIKPRNRTRSKSAFIPPTFGGDYDESNCSRDSLNSIGSKRGVKTRSYSTSTIGSHRRHSVADIQMDELIQMKAQIDGLVAILIEREEKLAKMTESREEMSNGRIGVQIFSVLAISIGHILDGTVLAYPSPGIPSLLEESSLHAEALHPSEMEINFIRSIHSVGATVACLLAGVAMSVIGRRGTTLYCTIPAYALGYLLIGGASTVWLVILGRFLTGIGLGLTLSVPTVYIVEVTNLPMRGALGVVPNLLCQIGIFGTYVSGRWLDWSGLAFLACGISVPFLLAVWYIPESPIFLIRRGRSDEAQSVIKALDLKTPASAFLTNADLLNGNKCSCWFSLRRLADSEVWKPVVSGLGLMFFFQSTAYPILIGTTIELFRETHIAIDEHLATVIVGIVIVLTAIVAVPLARNYDRKSLLLVSGIGTASCLFVLGAFFYLKDQAMGIEHLAWMPILAFLVYIAFFMCGYGSVSWLVVAELLPPTDRSFLYPLAIAGTWLFNFAFTHSYVPMTQSLTMSGTLWFYASLSFIGVAFVASCIPETRNRTSGQIARFFAQEWIFASESRKSWSQESKESLRSEAGFDSKSKAGSLTVTA